jgi:hypothetical protein
MPHVLELSERRFGCFVENLMDAMGATLIGPALCTTIAWAC